MFKTHFAAFLVAAVIFYIVGVKYPALGQKALGTVGLGG